MKNSAWLLLAVFNFCLTACAPDYAFQEVKEIPDNGAWAYPDTLNFNFSISDTVSRYNFYLDFEHSDTFPAQNIYLKLSTRFPDGHRLTRIRSFNFFDVQGAVLGKCSGHACALRTVLQENAYFKQTGEYILTVEQNTRIDHLPGIRSIGLVLEKVPRSK